MRYSLRTLLIVMLLAGPLGAYGWSRWTAYVEWKAQQTAKVAKKIGLSPANIRTGPTIILNSSLDLDLSEEELRELRQYDARRAAEKKEVEALVKKLSSEPLPDE